MDQDGLINHEASYLEVIDRLADSSIRGGYMRKDRATYDSAKGSFAETLRQSRRVAFPCGCTRSLYDNGEGPWAHALRPCDHGWALRSIIGEDGERRKAWTKREAA